MRSYLKPQLRSLLGALTLLAASVTVTGCMNTTEGANLDGTMNADGYALFAVDNERQQRDSVTVVVKDADPGATYVLLYSPTAPRNVGWFLMDPTQTSRCGGDTGAHCAVPGFGYLVDVATVRDGDSEVTLRDDRCGCNANSPDSDWTGHWAVMRVERTDRTNKILFDVQAHKVKDYAERPEILQLQ